MPAAAADTATAQHIALIADKIALALCKQKCTWTAGAQHTQALHVYDYQFCNNKEFCT
jgi:hypothetical protein